MNLLKLPTMVTFEIDKTLQQKRFLQNQSEVNYLIKKNHKNNNYYNQAQQITGLSYANLPDPQRIKFNESGVDSKIQGKMLQDQIRLKSLQQQFDQEKQKIEDEHNALTFRKKYPYGKENVRITSDVLEKYRTNNNFDQSEILKKFQQQARRRKQQQKMFKRTLYKSSDNRQYLNEQYFKNNNNNRNSHKKTSILQNEVNKIYENKKKNRYQKDNTKYQSYQKENRKFKEIEHMLKQVKLNLDLSISSLGAKQKKRLKQTKKRKEEQVLKERLERISILNKQQQNYRRKLPVVVYNQIRHNDKNYFSKVVCPDIDNYERKTKIERPEQFSQVFNIYNLNKKRLDQLSQMASIQQNKSFF